MKILIVTEQREGKWNNVSFEAVVAARQIGGQDATLSASSLEAV